MTDRRWFLVSLLVLAAACALRPPPAPQAPERKAPAAGERWFKGNTHTHTLNSDGDSPPSVVARWYRDQGYDFLVLSDHNFLTRVDVLQEEIDREIARANKEAKEAKEMKPPFLLIPGEEVSDKHGQAAIHVNALDSRRVIGAQGGQSLGEVLQRCIDAVRAAGGVPAVNHPNFGWSLTGDDLAAARGLRHFEVYNGHPEVHNWGGGGSPGLEEMWDGLLTRGVR
ncbi:MAG: PHP domain-containing protein, partial [Thermoanaerobaculia bacterium]